MHAKESRKIHHPRCDICERVFVDKSAQGNHMDAKHQSRCPNCWKCFQSGSAMEQHKAHKHGQYRCRPCHQRFNTENERDAHYRFGSAHRMTTRGSIAAQTSHQLPTATVTTVNHNDGLDALSVHAQHEHNDQDLPSPYTLEYAALLPLPPSPVALEATLRLADDNA